MARTFAALLTLVASACAHSTPLPAPSAEFSRDDLPATTPIKHVIVVIQENRSFNDLFATFPGAHGTTKGKLANGQSVALRVNSLDSRLDLTHAFGDYLRDYDRGKMDGFQSADYQYVAPRDVMPYWKIAKRNVLADNLFQTQGSGSFTAHQDLIRGDTQIDSSESLIDFPSRVPWGCDAPPRTTTSVLTLQQKYLPYAGPFPCLGYKTLRDLLDAKGISWKYYSPAIVGNTGATWNAFEAVRAVREGPQWATHVITPSRAILDDISRGALPDMSWVVPDAVNSDHPGRHSDTGPSWVAGIVNAVGESAYWKSSAILILWDDWGGFYDNAPPPFLDLHGGLGFRVPMLVVSPYARAGYVDHTQYEFGSVLRFVENTWALGRLGTTDERATGIGGCLDFHQKPRPFVPIPVKYSRAFFERQRPSNQPVDEE